MTFGFLLASVEEMFAIGQAYVYSTGRQKTDGRIDLSRVGVCWHGLTQRSDSPRADADVP